MSQSPRKPVALALGVLAGLALSPQAFAMTDLAAGYMLGASTHDHGHDHKAGEGKCGEGKCGGKKGHTIANMDTDKDGVVSRAEFAAAHDGDASRFARYDADRDGSITAAELDAGHAAMKQARDGKAGEGKCGEGKCGEGKCGGAP